LKRILAIFTFFLACSPFLDAQGQKCSGKPSLGCLIPNVYGPNGLVLPNAFHEAHFENDFLANFTPLNNAIATELTLLPTASPASGFTYTFERGSGVYTRSAQSFGPILSERGETIGRGKVFFSFTYQNFSFNSLDGIDLNNIPAVFKHARQVGAPYENDFITTANSLDVSVSQVTGFATVGITNRLDLSVAVPILRTHVAVRSDATIHRIAPPDPVFGQAHYFDANDPNGSVKKSFRDSGNAAGVGDVTLRLKDTLVRAEHASLALATDLRLPTGDERNFLGSGTYGVRPFLIASVTAGRVTPHLNIGYQINGKSVLAGDISDGTKGHLPNNFFYTVGADVGVNKRLTLAFDLLGQRVFNATSVLLDQPFAASAQEQPEPGVTPQGSYQQITNRQLSFNMVSGSAGFKAQLGSKTLLTTNLVFGLNNNGLHARVVPLVGLSHTF
jgi:hypothetical protein